MGWRWGGRGDGGVGGALLGCRYGAVADLRVVEGPRHETCIILANVSGAEIMRAWKKL
jgi:hypothetical protein